jgi:hypothetical protein
MVLISMHPFAFRRLFLVILAVAGFSALCFADPVLMARRYSPDATRATIARPPSPAPAAERFGNLDSNNLISPTLTGSSVFSLEEPSIPEQLAGPVAWSNRNRIWPIELPQVTATNSPFLAANTTDY